jgi:hypothetical protein
MRVLVIVSAEARTAKTVSFAAGRSPVPPARNFHEPSTIHCQAECTSRLPL